MAIFQDNIFIIDPQPLTHLRFSSLLENSRRVWKHKFHFGCFAVNLTSLPTLLTSGLDYCKATGCCEYLYKIATGRKSLNVIKAKHFNLSLIQVQAPSTTTKESPHHLQTISGAKIAQNICVSWVKIPPLVTGPN